MSLSSDGQRGLSLIELLVASALSASLGLLVVQLYNQSSATALAQRAAAQRLDNQVQMHHLLSHAIRDALVFDPSGRFILKTKSLKTKSECAGLFLLEQCLPAVMVWTAGDESPVLSPVVVQNSSLLLVKQHCCEGIHADLYYLAPRSGAAAGAAGGTARGAALFRRRLMADGRFAAADEMIPELQSFQLSLIRASGSTEPVHFSAQWGTAAVQVEAGFNPSDSAPATTLLFTIAARQGSVQRE